MLKKIILICVLVLLCLCGCNDDMYGNKKPNVQLEELVTVDYFLEYYGLTYEDIGDFDLQAMIVHYSVGKEDLAENSDFFIEKLNESIKDGTDFNCYASRYVREEYKRRASKEDDLRQAKYILLEVDVLGHSGREYPIQIFIHIEKNKIYYAEKNVWHDFSGADVIKELEDAQMDKIMTELIDMKIYKWKPGDTGTRGNKLEDYYWDLYIIMDRGDVITYSGGSSGANEKFEEWYNGLLEVIK